MVMTNISALAVDKRRKKYSFKCSSLRASAKLCQWIGKTLKFARDRKQLTLVNRRKEGRGYG